MVVVFPAPLRPTKPMHIPLSILNEALWMSSRGPIRNEKLETLITFLILIGASAGAQRALG